MNKLIEFNVPGGTVFVESQEAAGGSVVRGAGLAQVTEKVGTTFRETLSVIDPVAAAALDVCDSLQPVPDMVEIEFGLKFDIKCNAFIAESSAGGNLRVKIVWKPK